MKEMEPTMGGRPYPSLPPPIHQWPVNFVHNLLSCVLVTSLYLIHFTMSNLLFKVVILFLEYPLYRVFSMTYIPHRPHCIYHTWYSGGYTDQLSFRYRKLKSSNTVKTVVKYHANTYCIRCPSSQVRIYRQ